MLRQQAQNIYHHVEDRDPLYNDNPPFIPFLWLNSVSGELFSCTSNELNNNVWYGSLGTTVVFVPYWDETTFNSKYSVKTTDYYKDTLDKVEPNTYSNRVESSKVQNKGKRYVEVRVVCSEYLVSQDVCGITTKGNGTNQFGYTVGDYGISAGGSRVYAGGGTYIVGTNGLAITQTNPLFCLCFDFDNLRFCAGANGDYFGNGGTPNLDTGEYMFSIQALDDFVFAATIYRDTTEFILNTTGPFLYPAPTGFTSWED